MEQIKSRNPNELIIKIKELSFNLIVSRATFYKIVNNEVGVFLDNKTYEINLETLKKYKKLYNRLRRTYK